MYLQTESPTYVNIRHADTHTFIKRRSTYIFEIVHVSRLLDITGCVFRIFFFRSLIVLLVVIIIIVVLTKVSMILTWGREPETALFISGAKMKSLVHLWEMVPWCIYTMILYVQDMTFQCFIFPFCVHSTTTYCINLYLSYQFLSITPREKWIGRLQFFTCAKHIDFAALAHVLSWCCASPVSLGWSPDNAPNERPLTAGNGHA